MTTIATYATRTGGRVNLTLQPEDGARARHHAECDACQASNKETCYFDLPQVRDWAQKHAATCTALPKGYTDYGALAHELAAKALRENAQIALTNPSRAKIEATLRAAAIYAELERARNGA